MCGAILNAAAHKAALDKAAEKTDEKPVAQKRATANAFKSSSMALSKRGSRGEPTNETEAPSESFSKLTSHLKEKTLEPEEARKWVYKLGVFYIIIGLFIITMCIAFLRGYV